MTNGTGSTILDAMGQNMTMSEVLFERLKWEIVTGRVKPGQRLVERELTERFKVSRTPMREALKQLVRTQLAVDVPYRGVVVRSLGYDFAHDVYDLRLGIEGLSASLAAQRGTDEEIDHLKRMFDQIDAAADDADRDRLLVLNADFHTAIAEATHNPLLVQRVHELWTHINVVRGSSWVGNARTDSSRAEHKAIIDAIAARDAAKARLAMEEHIKSSWEVIEAAFRRLEEASQDDAKA